MPRKSAALRKATDDAKIPIPPDNDLDEKGVAAKGDDDKKPWETDDAEKSEDEDEDEDQDDTSKADDEDDDEDEDDKAVNKSAPSRRDLEKAIRLLTRHGEQTDPALRKEVLLAKEMRGGGLAKSERSELIGLLGGRAVGGATDHVVRAQAPGAALRKSMVANEAFAEAYDNLTKSVIAQSQHADGVFKSMSETQNLMARVLTSIGHSVRDMGERQAELAKSVDALGRQPAHGPRSVGLGYAQKSFSGGGAEPCLPGARGGRLEKSSRAEVRRALDELAKSSGNSEQRQAFRMAKDSLLMGRPLMPSIVARLEDHLAG